MHNPKAVVPIDVHSSHRANAGGLDGLVDLGFGFAKARMLMTAVELDLFTLLSDRPLSAREVADARQLESRAVPTFLDSLVHLNVLTRIGKQYAPTPTARMYLDSRSETYIGGLFQWLARRVSTFWPPLTSSLRDGRPVSEARDDGKLFPGIYAAPESLKNFCEGMTGLSLLPARVIAEFKEWKNYSSVLDLGTAEGCFCAVLAKAQEHLNIIGFDLPALADSFGEFTRSKNVADRTIFVAGDFFEDPLPKADVAVLGHILHDWGVSGRRRLLQRVYDALPDGGMLVIYDMMSDVHGGGSPVLPLLMDLHMALVTPEGGEYTSQQCAEWVRDAGFRLVRIEPLPLAHTALIAIKE